MIRIDKDVWFEWFYEMCREAAVRDEQLEAEDRAGGDPLEYAL